VDFWLEEGRGNLQTSFDAPGIAGKFRVPRENVLPSMGMKEGRGKNYNKLINE